ncbi:MAG: hypothetical protein ACKO96_04750, partial [Flammeovirgaceae bacterium]
MIRALKSILEDGHEYNIYRLDISKFYESVNLASILEKLRADPILAKSTIRVFDCFSKSVEKRGLCGLP